MRDWRSALITFLAIPLSLLAAVAVLERMGQTLNTMTLGGFAVALGVLVDDAIIGIENVLRRLGENAKLVQPRSRFDVIRDATLEVRGPVVYATLVVIIVFLPALFSTSVQGKFVGPLALAFILAVLASLGVALTAAPALSALMLKARDHHADFGWIASEVAGPGCRFIVVFAWSGGASHPDGGGRPCCLFCGSRPISASYFVMYGPARRLTRWMK